MRVRRGFTLIEALVTLIIMGMILSGLFFTFGTVQAAQTAVIDQGSSDIDAGSEIDDLSEHLHNAQVCTNPLGGIVGSSLAAGTAGSFSYYTDSNGSTVTYSVVGTNLTRTAGLGSTVVLPNVSSLQVSYYTMPEYYGVLSPTAIPNAPSLAEFPYVSAVKIAVTVSKNGSVATYSTTVRLRNSTVKQSVAG